MHVHRGKRDIAIVKVLEIEFAILQTETISKLIKFLGIAVNCQVVLLNFNRTMNLLKEL